MVKDLLEKPLKDSLKRRDDILSLEKELLACDDKVDLPVTHHFSHECYGRELFIPKGTVLVGKIHKQKTLNILAQGTITIFTEKGSIKVSAPHVSVSEAGIKKVGFAHTDCVFINVHATKETDVDKIEKEVTAKDYSEIIELNEVQKKELDKILEEENLCLG